MNLPNPDMCSTLSPDQSALLLTWLDTTKAYLETAWQAGDGYATYRKTGNEEGLDPGYYAFVRGPQRGAYTHIGPYDTFTLALAALARKANGGTL